MKVRSWSNLTRSRVPGAGISPASGMLVGKIRSHDDGLGDPIRLVIVQLEDRHVAERVDLGEGLVARRGPVNNVVVDQFRGQAELVGDELGGERAGRFGDVEFHMRGPFGFAVLNPDLICPYGEINFRYGAPVYPLVPYHLTLDTFCIEIRCD
jgi:hypothetical protein